MVFVVGKESASAQMDLFIIQFADSLLKHGLPDHLAWTIHYLLYTIHPSKRLHHILQNILLMFQSRRNADKPRRYIHFESFCFT